MSTETESRADSIDQRRDRLEDTRRFRRGEQSRLLSAIVGAVVTVVLSFIPLSAVVGGAVAGYLRGGDREEGLRVGALSGVVAAVPIVLLLALAIVGFGFIAIANGPRFGLALVAVFILGAVLVVAFVAGLSALGGYLAVLLVDGSDGDRARARASQAPADRSGGDDEDVGTGAGTPADASSDRSSATVPSDDDPTETDVATGVDPDGDGRPS
jgi:fatty acid desaturase